MRGKLVANVDWPAYKALSDTPGVWTRWMLEQTRELLQWPQTPKSLRDSLDPLLAQCLAEAPLPKPADHMGGAATDMFHLSLPVATVESLLAVIAAAQRADVRTSGTMSRGLGGFREAWMEYLQDRERDMSNDTGTASARVLAMIDGWNRMDLDAIVDCFADDAIYHNIPMEPVHGTTAIRESLTGFLHSASQVQWDVLNIAEDAQGVVLTERVDKFKIGSHWIEVPVMGTFEVSGDRICAWRDYFDLADFQAQMAALDD